MTSDNPRQSALSLCELFAIDDTAAADETRELTPAPNNSWLPQLIEELPKISLTPVGELVATGADLVAERVLGEGGMGVVTLCRQRSLSRDVAVKTVKVGDARSAAARALVEEARITGSLEHPGIVPVHSLGTGPDGLPMLVMKRVSGVVWRDMVRDPEHPAWEKVKGDRLTFHLDVLRKVCDAVHFAHSRGVVHRDLKTANVMIGEFGEVYVLDWGIACADGDREVTTRHVIGTPAFLAPEMLSNGEAPVTRRTDVYLLGGMLHEVLTGRARHGGTTVLQVLTNAWHSAPHDYPPSVSHELAALCNQAMHKDPSQRVPDARAFADALLNFHERRASERLAEAAYERLEALETLPLGADHAAAQRLWTEASFGFRQAIEAWADNPRALQGQREVTTWMVRHELACRNVHAARELLATLDPAPDDLAREVDRLDEELAAEASEVARVRALAREFDTKVSAPERARAAAVVAVVAAGVPLALAAFRGHGIIALTHGTLALVLAAVAALAGAFTWRWRGVFLANRAGRGLIAMPFVALAGVLVSLWVGAQLGLTASASVVTGLLVATAVFAAMAVTYDRRLFGVAGTTLLATLAGASLPAWVFEVTALAGLAASIEVALLFRAIATEAPRSPPRSE